MSPKTINGKYRKLPSLLFGVVFAVFIATMFHVVLNAHANGLIDDCLYALDYNSLCDETPIEHLGKWQIAFNIMPSKGLLLSILILLLGASAFYKTRISFDFALKGTILHDGISIVRKLVVASFNPLKEALSSGILNPKIH